MRTLCGHISQELKSEEGYSADIVRTYIPGDICPHNVGTMSTQHLTKDICLTREMLCGHSADIVRTYISRDICPHNVRTISFFGFHLWRSGIMSWKWTVLEITRPKFYCWRPWSYHPFSSCDNNSFKFAIFFSFFFSVSRDLKD